jgi:hypothetical protein
MLRHVTGTGTQPVIDDVPRPAWVLGWASLAAQVLALADRGLTDADSALLSAPLSALVVGWVSYGVLRARLVRTWLAAIVLGLVALLGLVSLVLSVGDASLLDVVSAVTGIVAFAALVAWTRTDVFRRLREDPRRAGPAFGTLVALAVTVGVLGGLTADPGDQRRGDNGFHVHVGL